MTTSTSASSRRSELKQLAFVVAIAIVVQVAIEGRFSMNERMAMHVGTLIVFSRLFHSTQARWASVIVWFAIAISLAILQSFK